MLVAIILDGARNGHFFAVSAADIRMKIFADGVLGEPIIDRFAVLLHLENVLAFRADMQRTFAASQEPREGHRRIGVVREQPRAGCRHQ